MSKREKPHEAIRAILAKWHDDEDEITTMQEMEGLAEEVIEQAQEWVCEHFGEHEWAHDQCGYWQHQHCLHCRASKYPDMAWKRCGELDAEMGKMTEQDWLRGYIPDTTLLGSDEIPEAGDEGWNGVISKWETITTPSMWLAGGQRIEGTVFRRPKNRTVLKVAKCQGCGATKQLVPDSPYCPECCPF